MRKAQEEAFWLTIKAFKEIGYVYDDVDGILRFYKEDLLELEFLTRVLGAGTEGRMSIKPLGITSEAYELSTFFQTLQWKLKQLVLMVKHTQLQFLNRQYM